MFEDKLFGMPMFRKKMFSQVPFGESGMLRFESTNDTITPELALSGGPTPLWQVQEAGGGTFIYETASFSHTKTAGTGNLTVRLINAEAVKDFVTLINFSVDGIVSDFWDLQIEKFTNLANLYLYSNSFTGDLSSWILPSSLIQLYIENNNFSGDLSSWVLPNLLINFSIYNNNFSGDLSSWIIPSTLSKLFMESNSFTAAPTIPIGASALSSYRIHFNGLSQAAVDQICLGIYNNRANFTYATPALNIGGTNAAPSGIYQDATPPTTGKEYIYKLVNDPDLEGFNKWTITYTA